MLRTTRSIPIIALVAVFLAVPGALSASPATDPGGAPTITSTSCELEGCGERGASSDPNGSASPSTWSDGMDDEGHDSIASGGVPAASAREARLGLGLTWLRALLPF